MTKPLVPRQRARNDIDDAVDYYRTEAGIEIATAFVEALERGYRAIAARPGSGSPRIGAELSLPGLRSKPVGRFPYRIFYIEHRDHIDVWRILHMQRDIPEVLRD